MNFEALTRNELLVARAKCDDDLLFFTKFWFRVLKGTKFITNWHHDQIRDDLYLVECYELEYLGINIPPRFSKTELAAVNFIARGIGMNPRSNWLYVSASDELRAMTSVSIREIVQHPYFKIMYDVELRKDQNAKNLWKTTQGGGLKTATISGQITGFGAGQMIEHDPSLIDFIRDFEGCIVLDDVNKIDDTENETANNQKVTRLLFNTILSRKNSKDTPIINIQQRAGEQDATYFFDEHYRGNPKARKLVIPARDKNGVPTWPFKLSHKELDALQKSPLTAHVFETQYMQNPTSPHGRPFHKTKLKYFKKAELANLLAQSEGCVSFIDCKDEGNDFYCHPFGILIGKMIYIVHVIHTQANTEVTIPKSVEGIKRFNCLHTVIETNGMGEMVYKTIRSQSAGHRIFPIHNSAAKRTRIAMNEAFICGYMVFMEDPDQIQDAEYVSYMEKLTGYAYDHTGKPDDAPDGTAGLGTLAMTKFKSLYI